MWKPIGDNRQSAWIGYDFVTATTVQSIRVKQFPNQYCAATPALQYSDDKSGWQTKFRLQCTFLRLIISLCSQKVSNRSIWMVFYLYFNNRAFCRTKRTYWPE